MGEQLTRLDKATGILDYRNKLPKSANEEENSFAPRKMPGKCLSNWQNGTIQPPPGAHGNGRNASTVMVRPCKLNERPTSFLPSFPPIICHHLPRRGGMNEAGAPPIWVACSQCKQAEGMAWLNLPGTCIEVIVLSRRTGQLPAASSKKELPAASINQLSLRHQRSLPRFRAQGKLSYPRVQARRCPTSPPSPTLFWQLATCKQLQVLLARAREAPSYQSNLYLRFHINHLKSSGCFL